MAKRKAFIVRLEVPPGVTVDMARRYVEAGVSRWCKGYDTAHKLYAIGDRVTVVPATPAELRKLAGGEP